MKRYRTRRTCGCADAFVIDDDGVERPLNPRLDLRRHSPSGYEWGYGGSGPAQLALAIVADAMGDQTAMTVYQEFKWEIVALRNRDGDWEIGEDDVAAICAAILAAR